MNTDTYKVFSVTGDNRHVVTVYEGDSYSEGYTLGVEHVEWCALNRADVTEVRMTRTTRFGETSISGRWGVKPKARPQGRSQWEINETSQPG